MAKNKSHEVIGNVSLDSSHLLPIGEEHENRHNWYASHVARHSPINKSRHKIRGWFRIKKNRYMTVITSLVVLVVLFLIPSVRFGALNTLGFRGAITVTVVDESTGLPLQAVTVTIGETEAVTDKSGLATVRGINLGPQDIEVEKLAYASYQNNLIVKTGMHKFDDVSLKPIGTQLAFDISSWLSDIEIVSAEVSYGENTVFSDDDGYALLTIPPTNQEEVEVSISADGYKTTQLTVSTTGQPTKVQLISDAKHFYLTERSGGYDLHKSDVDGSNDEIVLANVGQLDENTQLIVRTNSRSVFLLTKDIDKPNTDGSAIYKLRRIDSATNTSTTIDESESLRIYGLSDGKLVYLKVVSGVSIDNTERQKLISYDPISGRGIELASSNSFNSILVTDMAVYFAPSDFYKTDKTPYLFQSNPTTAGKTTIHADEVWAIYRTSYGEIIFDAQQDWYKVTTLDDAVPTALTAKPDNLFSRLYEDSPFSDMSIRVETSTGTSDLIILDKSTGDETSLYAKKGIKYPLRWVDENHVIFRVDDGEVADYILDVRGGEPHEITEVSDVPGSDRWYYYY